MRYFAVEVNAPGVVKRLYGGGNPGKATGVVRRMRSDCGWDARWPEPGSVGVVQAPTWKAGAEKVFAEQKRRGILKD